MADFCINVCNSSLKSGESICWSSNDIVLKDILEIQTIEFAMATKLPFYY